MLLNKLNIMTPKAIQGLIILIIIILLPLLLGLANKSNFDDDFEQ